MYAQGSAGVWEGRIIAFILGTFILFLAGIDDPPSWLMTVTEGIRPRCPKPRALPMDDDGGPTLPRAASTHLQ